MTTRRLLMTVAALSLLGGCGSHPLTNYRIASEAGFY
jgi:hypothetical protein